MFYLVIKRPCRMFNHGSFLIFVPSYLLSHPFEKTCRPSTTCSSFHIECFGWYCYMFVHLRHSWYLHTLYWKSSSTCSDVWKCFIFLFQLGCDCSGFGWVSLCLFGCLLSWMDYQQSVNCHNYHHKNFWNYFSWQPLHVSRVPKCI